MTIFSQLPLFLQDALKRQNITQPTPIQSKAILPVLQGKDVLGTAQTGTGKTFAFLLPLVVRLIENPQENALILSPTRELAQQTYDALKTLCDEEYTLKAALVIGGDNIHKQYASLRGKPRVIIATPGRVIDHMGRKSINLTKTHYLVLDETDRMLDMGFIGDIRQIVRALPLPRQTLLFSATLPKEIQALADEFLQKPVRVQIGSVTSPADLVLQEVVRVDIREKLPQLLHELNTRQGSVLIFVRTKHGAERLAKQLKLYGQKVNALHGDLRQNRRRQVLEFFRNGTVRILIATDVAARGIDVPHIAHVINFDLPQCPEDYIHRIGRTGRAGAVGSAVSLICGDEDKWKDICKVARFSVPVKEVQKTILPLPEPKFVAHEEGEAHAKNRRKKASSKEKAKPSKYTERAKELFGEEKPEKKAGKTEDDKQQLSSFPAIKKERKAVKPSTFRKASHAAEILNLQEEEKAVDFSFKKLKVGSRKKEKKAENKKIFRKVHKSSFFKKSKKHKNKRR